jgi:23S rRNA (guanosine2251-2'-O)-methyltransferase
MGRRGRSGKAKGGGAFRYPRLYGRHAVEAALGNPERTPRKLWVTSEIASRFHLPEGLSVEIGQAADLARLVPADAPHQGLVLEVEPLADLHLDDVIGRPGPIVVLDQVTDPHNVGAIIRSAAAFGAAALVTQDRHSPPESGALAKAASGALEVVPWVRVTNLARALDELAKAGYWRIGLDGEGDRTLAEALADMPIALVLGAEGPGMRQNVGAHCDVIARLPISGAVESLNVSNAAAVALYAVTAGR